MSAIASTNAKAGIKHLKNFFSFDPLCADKMEQTRLDRWHPPLKAPAVEVIDLLSDDELLGNALMDTNKPKERDASEEDSDSEESQSSLWEDILNAEDDDEVLHGSKVTQDSRMVRNC